MGGDNSLQQRPPLPLQLLILLVLLSCSANPNAICAQSVDCEALLAFKAGVKDPTGALAEWKPSNANCCAPWVGVSCVDGRVTQLQLSQLQLSGTLSPALAALSYLSTFNIDRNNLTGGIPESFARLAQLQWFDISYNKLSAPLPASIGGMTSLQHLRIYNNGISGPIPASFGQLYSLRNADLGYNRLSGQVPDAITANLTSLFYLLLDHNRITGLPSNLSNLKNVQIVYLDGNPLSGLGSIAGLATLPNLGELHVSGCGLSGPFPGWVANLPQLQNNSDQQQNLPDVVTPLIDLSYNALTGGIPWSLGSVANIVRLSLNNNQLSGPIPSSLSKLTTLQSLSLQQNNLYGPIPPAFAALRNLTMFNVSHNHLSGPIPQVAPFTTFPISSYQYNAGLCGKPLKKCK